MANMLNPMNWLRGEEPNNQLDTQNLKAEQQIELDNAIHRASLMNRVGDTRERETDRLSVSTIKPDWITDKKGEGGILGHWASPSFREQLQFSLADNKFTRTNDYRELAKQEKLESCIHELAISCMASHDKQEPVIGSLNGDYDEEIKEIVNKEIAKVLDYFKFDNRGQNYFKEFLTTGELAFENVFSVLQPELGILGVKAIPPETIEPIYRNHFNEEIEAFVLRKPSNSNFNKYTERSNRMQQSTATYDAIPMASAQVTYCNSGDYEALGNHQVVIPYIVKGQDAQKKLSLIEEAIVMNAVTNGPERLLWSIPTGDMDNAAKASYMRNFINGIKKKKGTDGKGNILDKFDPISITEDFYVPVDKDGKGASVTRVAGSQAFGSGFNGMLDYFHKKVYEDMHVPITRLNPDTAQSDGQTITMQELAFAERVIAIQKRFAAALKKCVITHLKLKGIKLHNESCKSRLVTENAKNGTQLIASDMTIFEQHLQLVERDYYKNNLRPSCKPEEREKLLHELGLSYWDQYEIREFDIEIVFSLPTTFLALREQQQFDLKWNNFNSMASSQFFSVYLLAKEHLDMSDDTIKKHLAWKKMEAKKTWEITQVLENGPEFREAAAAEAGMGGDMGGGSALGGDMGGMDDTPDFGGDDGLDDLEGGDEAPVDDAPVDEAPAGDEAPVDEPEV